MVAALAGTEHVRRDWIWLDRLAADSLKRQQGSEAVTPSPHLVCGCRDMHEPGPAVQARGLTPSLCRVIVDAQWTVRLGRSELS